MEGTMELKKKKMLTLDAGDAFGTSELSIPQ